MSIVFFNNEFVDEKDAKISIDDSGYYFGDGIYEVIMIYKGKLIEKDYHLDRLIECFRKIYFKNCPSKEEILNNIRLLMEKNPDVINGAVYMQFTRGNAKRDHVFLPLNLQPNALIKISSCTVAGEIHKWHCSLIEDPRRLRCDIKMVSLLPMVLAKYESEEQGFDDVIFFNSKINSLTEGSSYNVFIVSQDDKLITCPIGNHILPGCTRKRIIKIAKENGYAIEERFITKEELFKAKEVFTTSSIKIITAITKINGIQIGDGEIGKITKDLKNKYLDFLASYKDE